MDKDKGPLSWLKKVFFTTNQEKKTGKYQYLIIVLLFGAAIMLISNLMFQGDQTNNDIAVFKSEKEKKQDTPTFGQETSEEKDLITTYEEHYENQLKEALEGIQGVRDATVVVNVDSTEIQVLEKNRNSQTQTTEETDREGGKRKVEDSTEDEQLVIIRNGEQEVPIVVETKKPKIRGVLIVAKGAENIQVKKWIIEAVTRVLDVPSHRVAVMPKKN